jgi:muramoyltetrapeptide carboxypeptidase
MSGATRAGLLRCRPVKPGSQIALVAPASPFQREEFERGVRELERLGLLPVYDDRVFAWEPMVAGPADLRAAALRDAWRRSDIDGILAVRGGYGSVETLPLLDAGAIRTARTAFIGYSDVTSLHTYLTCHVGVVSIHGPMIEGRLAAGAAAYDTETFLRSLSDTPLGPLAPDGLEVLRAGEAEGPIFGGTLSQLVASLGTPYAFAPPAGHVLLIDEVAERPYRLRRMLMQLGLSGVLARASAVVVGQLPRCDEPGGEVTGRSIFADVLADFPGPVLFGFPTGHTTTPLVSVPLGVWTRVVGQGRPALVFDEAAAG